MTDVIFEAVALGVDSIISGAVISIIVAVLALNNKLNAYIAQQETFAKAATYYRQYSMYNNSRIMATNALSTFLYYDDDIDVIMIDVDLSPSVMKARIYEKLPNFDIMTVREYSITLDPSDNTVCYIKAGGYSIDTCKAEEQEISEKLRDAYKSGLYEKSPAIDIDYTRITTDINPYGEFQAYLLEDLAKYPETGALYSGSVVTRIWLERIDTEEVATP